MKTPKTPGEDERMETDFRADAPEGYFLTSGDRKSFETQYELLDTIGTGSFSEVKRCRHRQTGIFILFLFSSKNLDYIYLNSFNLKSFFFRLIHLKDKIVSKFQFLKCIFLQKSIYWRRKFINSWPYIIELRKAF